MKLEFSDANEESIRVGSIEKVAVELKDRLHIDSEIVDCSRLRIELEGFNIEGIEEYASEVIDFLRTYEGILECDYEIVGQYILEIEVIIE